MVFFLNVIYILFIMASLEPVLKHQRLFNLVVLVWPLIQDG